MSVAIEIPHNCGFLVYANVITYALFFLMLFWYVKLMRNSRVVQAVALLPMCFGYVQATCPTHNTFLGLGLILDLLLVVLLVLFKFKRIGLFVAFSNLLSRAEAYDGVYDEPDLEVQLKSAFATGLAVLAVSSITSYYNRRFLNYLKKYQLLQQVPIEDRMSTFFLMDMEITEELRSIMYVPWTFKSRLLMCLWKITGLHFFVPPQTYVYGGALKQFVFNTVLPTEHERVMFYLAFNGELVVDGVHLYKYPCPFEGVHPANVVCVHGTECYATPLSYGVLDLEHGQKEVLFDADEEGERPEVIIEKRVSRDDSVLKKRTIYSSDDIEKKSAKIGRCQSLHDVSSTPFKPLFESEGSFRDRATGRWYTKISWRMKRQMENLLFERVSRKRRRDFVYGKDTKDPFLDQYHELPSLPRNRPSGFVPPNFLNKDRMMTTYEEKKYALIKFWSSSDPDKELFVFPDCIYYVPKCHQVGVTPKNLAVYQLTQGFLPKLKIIQRNSWSPFFHGKENVKAFLCVYKDEEGRWKIQEGAHVMGAYAIHWYNPSYDQG